MHWFKIHHGFSSNPKLGHIAHKLNLSRALTNAIFIDMLEYASKNHIRGSIENYDCEVAAFNLGLDTVTVSNALLLLRNVLAQWGEYQSPIDSTNSERQRRHREKQKQKLNDTVTVSNALRNTDKIREDKNSKKEIEPKGSTKKQTRATRISEDWALPAEWGKWAEEEHKFTYEEIVFQAKKFKDYWIARADKGACKLDWQATWRNWIRSNIERK